MPELMKGNVYGERLHTIKYPVIAEVKYDEIRVHVKLFPATNDTPEHHAYIAEHVEFLSYAGNNLANLSLYSQQFLEFFHETGLTELDMGLEVNGNFNDSYRWVRSTKGIPKEKFDKKTGKTAPALDHSMLVFYLFDIPDDVLPFEQRRLNRGKHAATLQWHLRAKVKVPEHQWCQTEADTDRYFYDVRGAGYEGLMVKSRDHLYLKGKRTDGWLKMKPEAEADGVIIGFTEAVSLEGVPHGRCGSVTVRMPDGSEASPHGLPHELAKYIWENQAEFMGQWLQFNYMERDRQGGYRHPTWGRLREAK